MLLQKVQLPWATVYNSCCLYWQLGSRVGGKSAEAKSRTDGA